MEAKRTGGNVMILTDFDTDGVKIAFELEGVTRIGIDFESIDQINEYIEAELEGKIHLSRIQNHRRWGR